MAKSTTTKNAFVAAKQVGKNNAARNQSAKTAGDTIEANDDDSEVGEVGVSAWARERARALAGTGKAADRCNRLAEYLQGVAAKQKPGVSALVAYATINAGVGLKRGERGDMVRSFATSVSRMRSMYNAASVPLGFDVKSEADGLRVTAIAA